MENVRIVNAKRNVVTGMGKAILNIFLPFVIRTMVLYILGAQYMGLGGLFGSILQVLSLADFGFSSVVTYILYKPVSEDDKGSIGAILNFLKTVYRKVGLVILALGLILTPFLGFFISGDYPSDINIYVLYIIYLLNTSLSYLFVSYKRPLVTSSQREDILSSIDIITNILFSVMQILSLAIWKNYYLFSIMMILGTIFNNILLNVVFKKNFPDITISGNMDDDTKKIFNKQIKGMLLNRLGDTSRNSFDAIIISSFLGLTFVAIYNNYYYVYSCAYGLTLVIFDSLIAGVGNSLVTESVDKNYKDLCKYSFLFSYISGWFVTLLFCLYQPFMKVWLGSDTNLLLPFKDMALFCIYFYIISMNNSRNLYVNARGLFWEFRIWYIVEALLNLVLNILLGYFFGITGVIVATIITIFVFNYLVRTIHLFKIYFGFSSKGFFMGQIKYTLINLVILAMTYMLCELIKPEGVWGFAIKVILCVIVPNVVFVMAYHRNTYFSDILSDIKLKVVR